MHFFLPLFPNSNTASHPQEVVPSSGWSTTLIPLLEINAIHGQHPDFSRTMTRVVRAVKTSSAPTQTGVLDFKVLVMRSKENARFFYAKLTASSSQFKLGRSSSQVKYSIPVFPQYQADVFIIVLILKVLQGYHVSICNQTVMIESLC